MNPIKWLLSKIQKLKDFHDLIYKVDEAGKAWLKAEIITAFEAKDYERANKLQGHLQVLQWIEYEAYVGVEDKLRIFP